MLSLRALGMLLALLHVASQLELNKNETSDKET